MEKCQRSPEEIAKYGPLTEEQMERMAKVRGLLALTSTTKDGRKRMEFVNRGFHAAINVRRCAAMEKRPSESTRGNFIAQPLKVAVYEKKLKPVVGGRSKKNWEASASQLVTSCIGRVCHCCTTGSNFFLLKDVCFQGCGRANLFSSGTCV